MPNADPKWAAQLARRPAGLAAGGATIAIWVVLTGTVFLLGPASPAVLAALLATTAPAIWLWRRLDATQPATRRPAPMPPAAALSPRSTIGEMSTSELCRAWQSSYWALREEPDSATRNALVHVRQLMLDELERRDAPGLGRWLATGARAGSDPRRYLTPDP